MLSASQPMRAPIVRAVGPDDIGEVDSPRSLRADARGDGRRRQVEMNAERARGRPVIKVRPATVADVNDREKVAHSDR